MINKMKQTIWLDVEKLKYQLNLREYENIIVI